MVFDAPALNTHGRRYQYRSKGLDELGQAMAAGLAGSQHAAAYHGLCAPGCGARGVPIARADPGQRDDGWQKSKTLYHVDGVAAIHSQRSATPSAPSTPGTKAPKNWPHRGGALRLRHHPGQGLPPAQAKLDFYTLLDNWLLKDQVPPVEQQHFVMAVLIRGGVFGDAS